MGPDTMGRATAYVIVPTRIDRLLRARGLPLNTRVTEQILQSWERTDAHLAAKRRQHCHKASRAAIRRLTT